MLNEISHREAYQFYVACKTSFRNLLDDDLKAFHGYQLIQIRTDAKGKVLIDITQLGTAFCDRITVLITEKKYEFHNERIYFHEAFFS